MNAVLFTKSFAVDVIEFEEVSMDEVLGIVGPGIDQMHLSPRAEAGLQRAEIVDRLEADFHHEVFRKVYHLPQLA
jgi:hypothetical protein